MSESKRPLALEAKFCSAIQTLVVVANYINNTVQDPKQRLSLISQLYWFNFNKFKTYAIEYHHNIHVSKYCGLPYTCKGDPMFLIRNLQKIISHCGLSTKISTQFKQELSILRKEYTEPIALIYMAYIKSCAHLQPS